MSLYRKLLLFSIMAFLLCSQKNVFAQAEAEIFTAKNSVYAEIGGNSGGYALNYARIFHQKGRLKISASAGFSMLHRRAGEPISPSYWAPVFPAEITAFLGRSRHHFEFGTGFFAKQERDYIFEADLPDRIREKSYWDKFITARIGYRCQKPDGGFFFRAGYTPMVGFYNSVSAEKPVVFYPFGVGISLGISF